MQHLDHDRLVFLALGESEAETGEARHLGDCEHCRVEMETLRHVAGLGSQTQTLRDLPDPPERVWQGIVAEIAAAEELPSLADARRQPAAPDTTGAAVPVRPAPRRRDRMPRWMLTAVTATAAAALGVVGTLVALRPADPEPEPRPAILASAPLTAYGSTPRDANGDARVFKDGRLHLHVANLPEVPGYYEVWLIDPDTMKMFSVGTLGDSPDALLPLPPNVDLNRYSVVDVSAEQFDSNTAHSGDSLLRGTLTS